MKKLLITLAAIALGLLLVGTFDVSAKRPAHAGNPNHSISIADAAPGFGATVTVVYETTEDEPWAHIQCFGNETTIGQEDGMTLEGFVRLDLSQTFTLGPTPSWSGGGSDCVLGLGRMQHGFHVLATFEFAVSP